MLPRSNPALPPAATPFRSRVPGKTYLDMNELMFDEPLPPGIAAAAASICTANGGCSRYPLDGPLDAELRRLLSNYLSHDSNDLAPENVLVTRGADGALRQAFETFAFAGTTTLVPVPTYEQAVRLVALAGGEVKRTPMLSADAFGRVVGQALRPGALPPHLQHHRHHHHNHHHHHHNHHQRDAVPQVVYFSNPNNPLGFVVPRSEILKAVDGSPRTTFVVDEVYMEYSNVDESVAAHVRGRPNLLVVRSFSKAFGLAGLRLGCLVADAATLALVGPTGCPTEVLDVARAAGAACLRDHLPYFRRHFARVRALRTDTVAALAPLLGSESVSAGSGGMFLVLDVDDPDRFLRHMDERHDVVLASRTLPDGRVVVRAQVGDAEACRALVRGAADYARQSVLSD